jgi:hypothetical protein
MVLNQLTQKLRPFVSFSFLMQKVCHQSEAGSRRGEKRERPITGAQVFPQFPAKFLSNLFAQEARHVPHVVKEVKK